MATKSIGMDLTQGHVGKLMLRFAAPFMLANLLQTVYNLVDVAVVGRFVGTGGLSAVSTCGELIQLFTYIAMGFSGAGQTMIGQFIGAQDRARVKQTIGTLSTSLAALALAVTLTCFATARWLLTAVNLPTEAMQDGMAYLLICAGGMVFIFGYNMVSAVLRGMGDSKHPLIFIAVAAVTNLLLDLLLVAVFHLGAAGAALATVLGQAISFFASLVYLYRHRETFGFDFSRNSFRPQKTLMLTLFRLGVPMSVQGVLISVSMLYVFRIVNEFGVAASAANGISTKLCSIIRIVSNSMGTAGSAMIAQCMGAKKFDRVHQVVRWVFLVTFMAALLCAAGILFFPTQIFALFDNSPDVLHYAVIYSLFGVFDYLGFAIRSPCNSILNGTGAAALGLTAGICDGVVARIGCSLLFGRILGMGVAGCWLGNTIAGFIYGIICGPYYASGVWKRKKLFDESER